MTPDLWTEVYWFIFAVAVFGCLLAAFVWYGLKRLGPPED